MGIKSEAILAAVGTSPVYIQIPVVRKSSTDPVAGRGTLNLSVFVLLHFSGHPIRKSRMFIPSEVWLLYNSVNPQRVQLMVINFLFCISKILAKFPPVA